VAHLPDGWPPTPIEFRQLCVMAKHGDGFDPGWRKDHDHLWNHRLENMTAKQEQAERNRANLQRLKAEMHL